MFLSVCVCVCVWEHLWNAQCVSLCVCVSAAEKWEANGGVEMRLCAVLWDLGICVAVIINRLALSKITRDWKLIHKVGLQRPLHLLILCLSISPSFSPNITEQLHHPPPTHPPKKNKISSNATKYSHTQTDAQNNIGGNNWIDTNGGDTEYRSDTKCVSAPMKKYLCAFCSLLSCLPRCSVYLHRFTVAQAHPNWLGVSGALGV